MGTKSNISRNLIIVVIVLFLFSIGLIYWILSSATVAEFGIRESIARFVNSDGLQISIGKIKGCFLDGLEIDKVELKSVKPYCEASVNNIAVGLNLDNIKKGLVGLDINISKVECLGHIKLSPTVASAPAFIGPICLAALPGNLRIDEFSINSVRLLPFNDDKFIIDSSLFKLKGNESMDSASMTVGLNASWKGKPIAKLDFSGKLEQHNGKIDGLLALDCAKQHIESELTITNGKKGVEYSGYIASSTILDLLPISQWLGYLWQVDYPYALSGKISACGSWLYNNEVGFLGNLKGNYNDIALSLLGAFYEIAKFNGEWRVFDGSVEFTDNKSFFMGFPASLNGKIESFLLPGRKFDISFLSKEMDLEVWVKSLPWVLKYTYGIPDLSGSLDISVLLSGNRPVFNLKTDLKNVSQIDEKIKPIVGVTGKATYTLPETGSDTVNIKMLAESRFGMPSFFKRFTNGLFASENKRNLPASYDYRINGSTDGVMKLNGKYYIDGSEAFETNGSVVDGRVFIKTNLKENRTCDLHDADPIDLLLMR